MLTKDSRLWLTAGELMVIDWYTCEASHAMSVGLESIVEDWDEIRSRVWQSLERCDSTDVTHETPILLEGRICKMLLNLLPTTHFWPGDKSDAGFSLKTKLAAFRRGEYTHIDRADTQAAVAEEPQLT